jgi:tRNA (guanine37-N1)-methyltransferase
MRRHDVWRHGMSHEYSGGVTAHSRLRIDILTLFPAMFQGPFDHSMVARARAADIVDLQVHDLRGWATGKHRTTDDYSYGGGGGMVLMAEPVFRAVAALLDAPQMSAAAPARPLHPIVLLSPQGVPFDDALAREFADADRLLLICGHYEGFDERLRTHLATHEVSVGDFVVTGGELPAMLVTDAVVRLRPGVVGLPGGTLSESFATGLLEHPHYTRPADFRGWTVPAVLRSGDHAAIAGWRRHEALRGTWERRPDLLVAAELSPAERGLIERWDAEER